MDHRAVALDMRRTIIAPRGRHSETGECCICLQSLASRMVTYLPCGHHVCTRCSDGIRDRMVILRLRPPVQSDALQLSCIQSIKTRWKCPLCRMVVSL